MHKCKVPSCAFNGNLDVFVDVGNKMYGVQALQTYLGIERSQSLHFGDRFTTTGADRTRHETRALTAAGNDIAVREVALTVWVANPVETCLMLSLLLKEMGSEIRPYHAPRDAGLPAMSTLTSAWGSVIEVPPSPSLSRRQSQKQVSTMPLV